jgi:raffinose/stachyose/melibiose transport system permease protein
MKVSVSRLFRNTGVIMICLICLIPFYVLLILSLNSPQRMFYEGNMFIPDFVFTNFIEAWRVSHIGRAVMNSLCITAGALGLVILCGTMAGYTIARFRVLWNSLIFKVLLSCMMIPGIINTVPLYTLMRRFHAINTLWGMVLVCAALALPGSVFIFTNYVKGLPRDMEEAAIIDGCSWFSAFWQVTFPIMRPAVSAVCILNGFGIWNNYSQAVFFLQKQQKHNIPQALSVFFQQFSGTKWHLMAAAAVLAIVPVVFIFLIFQKQLIRGLTDGAVKG